MHKAAFSQKGGCFIALVHHRLTGGPLIPRPRSYTTTKYRIVGIPIDMYGVGCTIHNGSDSSIATAIPSAILHEYCRRRAVQHCMDKAGHISSAILHENGRLYPISNTILRDNATPPLPRRRRRGRLSVTSYRPCPPRPWVGRKTPGSS